VLFVLLDHQRLWALVLLPWVRMFHCRGCQRRQSYYPVSHGHGSIRCHKRCWLRRESWGCRTLCWISSSLMDRTRTLRALHLSLPLLFCYHSCWTFGFGRYGSNPFDCMFAFTDRSIQFFTHPPVLREYCSSEDTRSSGSTIGLLCHVFIICAPLN
jgi:hypothetical protein